MHSSDSTLPARPGVSPRPKSPHDPPHPVSPGATFRGLHIHSRLGGGGMGDAWLASHPILRTPLVVKTFRHGVDSALFREAHLAARVVSPHVVPAIDAGTVDGLPFVVQRYVDGVDCGELLQRLGRAGRALPLRVATRLVVDVALGLHAIHQAGVIHRDVKPANLFLGGDGRAAVGDFGVAATRHVASTDPALPSGDAEDEPLGGSRCSWRPSCGMARQRTGRPTSSR